MPPPLVIPRRSLSATIEEPSTCHMLMRVLEPRVQWGIGSQILGRWGSRKENKIESWGHAPGLGVSKALHPIPRAKNKQVKLSYVC